MNAARRARKKSRSQLPPEAPDPLARQDVTVTAGTASASGAADPEQRE